jgi:hypothetical protein
VCPRDPEPGDLIEALDRPGERGDQLLDRGFELGNVAGQTQPVEACASTSSVNISEGFFQL